MHFKVFLTWMLSVLHSGLSQYNDLIGWEKPVQSKMTPEEQSTLGSSWNLTWPFLLFCLFCRFLSWVECGRQKISIFSWNIIIVSKASTILCSQATPLELNFLLFSRPPKKTEKMALLFILLPKYNWETEHYRLLKKGIRYFSFLNKEAI